MENGKFQVLTFIRNNYFKGGVGKSKLSTMFAYLTDKLNLKVLMIDKDLQATLTKDLAKTFKVELPRVNFYEGLKNGNLASSIVHLTDNLDLIPGTFDLMLLPKLTRSWTFENESRLLATLLAPLKSDYDLIIIDTVPTPSVYTNNAIVASDYVMIPLQAEEESTNNIQNYISYLIDLQETLRALPTLWWIVLNQSSFYCSQNVLKRRPVVFDNAFTPMCHVVKICFRGFDFSSR